MTYFLRLACLLLIYFFISLWVPFIAWIWSSDVSLGNSPGSLSVIEQTHGAGQDTATEWIPLSRGPSAPGSPCPLPLGIQIMALNAGVW